MSRVSNHCSNRVYVFFGRQEFRRNFLLATLVRNHFNGQQQALPAQITGVLNFGDMAYAPLIYDLAVALAFQFSGDDDDAVGITHRYHQIIPLELQELELLYDLITTRQVLSLLIEHWRASLCPENRQYSNSPISRVGIERLAVLDRDEVTQTLIDRCLN